MQLHTQFIRGGFGSRKLSFGSAERRGVPSTPVPQSLLWAGNAHTPGIVGGGCFGGRVEPVVGSSGDHWIRCVLEKLNR